MSMENPTQNEIIEKESLEKTMLNVPAGQEWVVKQLLKCRVIVENGGKLTVTEMAAKNDIIVKEGGELQITGEDLKNSIIRDKKNDEQEVAIKSVPEILQEKIEVGEEEKQKILFTIGIDEKTMKNNIRYNAFLTSGDVKVLATDKVLEIMGNDPTHILSPEEEKIMRNYIKEINFLTQLRKEAGLA